MAWLQLIRPVVARAPTRGHGCGHTAPDHFFFRCSLSGLWNSVLSLVCVCGGWVTVAWPLLQKGKHSYFRKYVSPVTQKTKRIQ
jgi:hypothetical protein